MNISIVDIKKKLGISGTDLNSRDWGIQIRKEIEQIIKGNKVGDVTIYLDFSGITSFNSSIADEVIVLLMKDIVKQKSLRFLISVNVPDNSLFDLELVTSHRKIPCLVRFNNKIYPDIICGKDASKMELNERTIYDLVCKLKKCSAREIADLMKKDIYTASTYLNRLFKMRLLTREEQIDSQGKQYIYMPVK